MPTSFMRLFFLRRIDICTKFGLRLRTLVGFNNSYYFSRFWNYFSVYMVVLVYFHSKKALLTKVIPIPPHFGVKERQAINTFMRFLVNRWPSIKCEIYVTIKKAIYLKEIFCFIWAILCFEYLHCCIETWCVQSTSVDCPHYHFLDFGDKVIW